MASITTDAITAASPFTEFTYSFFMYCTQLELLSVMSTLSVVHCVFLTCDVISGFPMSDGSHPQFPAVVITPVCDGRPLRSRSATQLVKSTVDLGRFPPPSGFD